MVGRGKGAAGALLFLLLASFAWSPVFSGGPFGSDFRLLARQGAAHGGELAFLSRQSLALTRLLAGGAVADERLAWWLRVENLLWLGLAAAFWQRVVQRALRPWCGAEHARAAGWISAGFLCLQPILPVALAGASGRPGALGLFLGATAAALFLSGRQERRPARVAAALVLTALSGWVAREAWVLVLGLSAVEYASARRHRPRAARLRTTASTLIAFGAAVALARWVDAGSGALPPLVPEHGESVARTLLSALERLGLLILPLNAAAFPRWTLVPFALLFLLGLAPALQGARTAPKLWIAKGAAALAALLAFAWFGTQARVNEREMNQAATLALAAVVPATALAVASTSRLGWLRLALPLGLGLVFAILARGQSLAVGSVGRQLAQLRQALDRARSLASPSGEALILTGPLSPLSSGGLHALEGAVPWMGEALFARKDMAGERVGLVLRRASERAFAVWAQADAVLGEDSLRAARERGLVVLRAEAKETEPPWKAERLEPPRPSGGARSWFGELRSPADMDLDPLSEAALVVRAQVVADEGDPPLVAWRAENSELSSGQLAGQWVSRSDVPRAVFDLSSSLDWLLCKRVRQLWIARGAARLDEAQLRLRLDVPGGEWEPRAAGPDWMFEPQSQVLQPLSSAPERWFLTLLEPRSLELVELSADRTEGSSLRLPRAGARASELSRGGSLALVWSIERRLGRTAVERVQGLLR
jgi:hypothetical protein